MLRFQINPHFLFNSLNSVNSLIITRPEEAQTMVIRLSEFMRYSLESSGNAMSTFEKELLHCNLYLDIERVRFGDRLQVSVQMEPSLLFAPMPAMLLQPLVENAIKHGLNDLEEGVLITISAHKPPGEVFRVTITNPYDPLQRGARAGTGTGLRNIRARLENLYSRNDLVAITMEGGIFRITIKIPENAAHDPLPDHR